MTTLHAPVLDWYAENSRDLPWRRPEASAWSVLVSEVMLQQTPVVRVLPVHQQWMERWPKPGDLAAEPAGEAVRAWGRLGYPRRALRLHAAATAIVERYAGELPESYDELLTLPGVGDYTAAAVAAFAFGQRQVVLDTNVRRVLARVLAGTELPPASVTRAERAAAEAVLPSVASGAAPTWSVAVMELGALVCHASAPRCGECPVVDSCAWHAAGRPAHTGAPRRAQAWQGTDRQCRGRLLAVVRDSQEPVHVSRLEAAWPGDPAQRARALESLVRDGLVVRRSVATYGLSG
ncbi:MAG TPA: A/G-specific adenine glycosylase [Nocardioides sp.]|uniref:A/G-specific adenine glycosylase n=1 Tax=Nocardioides sp. TaxID=35761 RepID=UPI002E3307AF|nr:A/G-specific adenine glycosylase [Nocardioides sp.]HEX5089877.1 A/G-specific adenine glycosylase [Nocardioides sp.]